VRWVGLYGGKKKEKKKKKKDADKYRVAWINTVSPNTRG
jgi:hypothetical protein